MKETIKKVGVSILVAGALGLNYILSPITPAFAQEQKRIELVDEKQKAASNAFLQSLQKKGEKKPAQKTTVKPAPQDTAAQEAARRARQDALAAKCSAMPTDELAVNLNGKTSTINIPGCNYWEDEAKRIPDRDSFGTRFAEELMGPAGIPGNALVYGTINGKPIGTQANPIKFIPNGREINPALIGAFDKNRLDNATLYFTTPKAVAKTPETEGEKPAVPVVTTGTYTFDINGDNSNDSIGEQGNQWYLNNNPISSNMLLLTLEDNFGDVKGLDAQYGEDKFDTSAGIKMYAQALRNGQSDGLTQLVSELAIEQRMNRTNLLRLYTDMALSKLSAQEYNKGKNLEEVSQLYAKRKNLLETYLTGVLNPIASTVNLFKNITGIRYNGNEEAVITLTSAVHTAEQLWLNASESGPISSQDLNRGAKHIYQAMDKFFNNTKDTRQLNYGGNQ